MPTNPFTYLRGHHDVVFVCLFVRLFVLWRGMRVGAILLDIL